MRGVQRQTSVRSDSSADLDSTTTESKRKLILHFDQHNTIQVAMKLPLAQVTVEEGLNNFLTSAVWGKEDENGNWQWVSNEPSIDRPPKEPNAITYYKYMEKKVPNDRVEFKKKLVNFVNESDTKFKPFFDLYLENLRYESQTLVNNNSHDGETPCNTIQSKDKDNNSLYHLILPSFFEMIRQLQQQEREFTIILRTMGIESQRFLDTVRAVLQGKHPNFKDIKPIHINDSIGRIIRSKKQIKLEIEGQVFEGDLAIYKKLTSMKGINAIRDDYEFFMKNNYLCYMGKPLWIDLDDVKHQHIFFDDNIRLDYDNDCNVNIRLRNKDAESFEDFPFKDYQLFKKSNILQPNLIELLNPHLKKTSNNYYLELIHEAERVYNKFIVNSIRNTPIVNFSSVSPNVSLKNHHQNSIISVNGEFESVIKEEKEKIEKENTIMSKICLLQ